MIGRALALLPDDSPLEVTMIGRGQDYAETRALVGEDSRVTWIDWLPMSALTSLVAEHDVCLGIFGDSPKSLRVVPTKAFQGAAAGCAIVTSDTRPQRRLLADAAVYVRPGNAGALASALDRLAHNPDEVRSLRKRASELANRSFDPAHCAAPIVSELARRTSTVLT